MFNMFNNLYVLCDIYVQMIQNNYDLLMLMICKY